LIGALLGSFLEGAGHNDILDRAGPALAMEIASWSSETTGA
jgi:hypothetical protein